MVIASNGNLTLEVIDPEPFSEQEDLATSYGIQAVPLTVTFMTATSLSLLPLLPLRVMKFTHQKVRNLTKCHEQ